MPKQKLVVGWKEWVSLPELGIPLVEAKLDTGAKTSALHAFELDTFETPDGLHLRFGLHPDRHSDSGPIQCHARVVEQRMVSDSGGHRELRWVIRTPLLIGGRLWPIEVTLTNRETMAYRMLLGREALRGRMLVDAEYAHLLGQASTLTVSSRPNRKHNQPQT